MTSPEKSFGGAAASLGKLATFVGGSVSGINNHTNASVYSAIYRTPRDQRNNDRDFSKEIRVDMVNEMITEWSKLSSLVAKTTISEHINIDASVPHPTHVCSPEPRAANLNMFGKRQKTNQLNS